MSSLEPRTTASGETRFFYRARPSKRYAGSRATSVPALSSKHPACRSSRSRSGQLHILMWILRTPLLLLEVFSSVEESLFLGLGNPGNRHPCCTARSVVLWNMHVNAGDPKIVDDGSYASHSFCGPRNA